MKRFKIISILLVLVLLLSACGGKTETPSGSGTDKPSGTQTPAVPLSPSNPSTGKTDTPKTDDPAQAADIYESLVGTWVAVEGETEGYRYDAPADGVIVQVEFMPNHVAIYKESSVESDTQVEYYYGIFPEEGPLYGSGENWHMDLHDSEYSVQKSVSMENGRLIMDLQGDYIMGGTLFFEKVATKMLAQVTVMEAGDYNTADDGSFKPDPGWFENVVASVELSPRNPADTMYWQLIEAKEDKVRVCLEENYDGSDFFSMILYEDDSFAAVSNQGTVILNKGEILAVKASEPWICEYRAWLSKDEFWGSFEFESHREVKDGRVF